MNKTEFIANVAEKLNISKVEAGKTVNAVLDTVVETLARGESVQIIGFGNFEIRERTEHNGISPATGETIVIPASKLPVFRAGKTLKMAVKG